MFLLRSFGSLLVLVAVIALVSDVTRGPTSATGFTATPLGRHWEEFAPHSLAVSKAAVKGSLHPAVWDSGLAKVLQVPTWMALSGTGALICYLGRRRRRVRIFAN